MKVFNNEGEFLYDIREQRPSGLRFPVGLVVDKFNNLIICGNNNLLVFTLEGKFLQGIKGKSTELEQPWAAAVSSNTGQLFITDMAKHCVHILE